MLRALTRLGEPGPRPKAVLLDLAKEGSFYIYDGDMSYANLAAFEAAFRAGKLVPQKGGALETLTVVGMMNRPAGGGDENMEDVNPWLVGLQCLLCPLTCPLLCCFRRAPPPRGGPCCPCCWRQKPEPQKRRSRARRCCQCCCLGTLMMA